jgi:hypothetical protein
VIGSLVVTTSPVPRPKRPPESLLTGLRTVGANLPTRVPLSSVTSTFLQRSASSGMPLIDRLPVVIEFRLPEQRFGLIRTRNGKGESFR